MDADLQDPPEVILELARRWREGFDVVYAVRRADAGEKHFKRKTATLFYRLLRKLSEVDIPADVGDFRLVDRNALEAYKTMREEDRFVAECSAGSASSRRAFPTSVTSGTRARRSTRCAGCSSSRSDGIVSFSNAPLRLALALGFAVSLASFVYGFVAIILKAAGAFTVPGWTSVIFVLRFLGGVQLMVLGVIGEYVGKAYKEAKKRPLYIVSSVTGVDGIRAPERAVVWQPQPQKSGSPEDGDARAPRDAPHECRLTPRRSEGYAFPTARSSSSLANSWPSARATRP